jgi:outer membrane protein assembly factor BamB
MARHHTAAAGFKPLLTALLGTVLLCVGCSSPSAKKNSDKPVALIPIPNHLAVQRVWSAKLGGEAPKLRLGLGVAASATHLFAANHKGTVESRELQTGHLMWRRELKAPLSAGPATALGIVVVASSKGEVIALDETDGKPRWRIRINAEILSAPAIGNDLVVVRTVDGKLHGLSISDGADLWVADQQVPRLSLRGTSEPIIVGDLAISGFDNGRVMAVARGNGGTAWDAPVGQSHGSTELQRLIDVDARVMAAGDDLFAVAYQGRVARIARETGQIIWARDLSSYRGLAVDDNALYVSTSDGELTRVDRSNGTEQWTQKSLARRQLTAPAIYDGRVVVADAGGVVHWLDPANGEFLARAEIGKAVGRKPVQSKGISYKRRISATPLVAGGLLLVFSDSGEISAYRAGSATTASTLKPIAMQSTGAQP